MPVIRTEADRKADALLEDDKHDWLKAHRIATLKTREERAAALDQLELDTDSVYREMIADRVIIVWHNRKKKANALADQASVNYQKAFKGEQGGGAKRGVTGTVRRQPKSGAKGHIASMLDSLSEGVTT